MAVDSGTAAREYPSNLPAALTSFVGRTREQAEITGLLARHRSVTVVGPGGAGKSRLALEVAQALLVRFPDGVWLVELAALSDPALVAQQVADTLGIDETPGRPILSTLIGALRRKSLLLVLDNCEHLVNATADLAVALLRGVPAVCLLVSSRESLRIAGEQVYRLSPLEIPDPENLPPLEQLARIEAVQYFLTRARSYSRDFALTTRNAPAVASLCARLDGIPLALELAAARLSALTVEGVAARLDDRFHLLTGGTRDVLPHQRTLRAVLDWSYDLLSEPERALLRRLSVFAGSWTLEAAEAVCANLPSPARPDGEQDAVQPGMVLDLITGLVDKSMVVGTAGTVLTAPAEPMAAAGDGIRYCLLGSVRLYSAEKLEAAEEADTVQGRYLSWYVALAERAEPELTRPEQARWLARLHQEHDNLRAALTCGAGGDAEAAALVLRLAGALWRFWSMRGHLNEGRRWLDEALARAVDAPAAVRSKALLGAGRLLREQGDSQSARSRFEESLALSREAGDRRGMAGALHFLALVARDLGDRDRATALYEECLTLRRAIVDHRGIATALQGLADLALDQGEYASAEALYTESLPLAETLQDTSNIAWIHVNLGRVALAQAALARAGMLFEDGLVTFRALGEITGVANAAENLGRLALARSDPATARAWFLESLALCQRGGSRRGVTESLAGLAATFGALGQPVRAARLFGAAWGQREALGIPLSPMDRHWLDSVTTPVRDTLGESAWMAAWIEGQSLSSEASSALAQSPDPEQPVGPPIVQIEIDHDRVEREVAEITGGDMFESLRRLRERRRL